MSTSNSQHPLPELPPIEEQAALHHVALVNDMTAVMNTLRPSLEVLFRQLASVTTAWMTHQGFWESHNFGEKVALVHSELSEALEAHRKSLASDHLPQYSGVEEELADAVIRILDLVGAHNINLGAVLVDKFLFNLNRPHKHGKAY